MPQTPEYEVRNSIGKNNIGKNGIDKNIKTTW